MTTELIVIIHICKLDRTPLLYAYTPVLGDNDACSLFCPTCKTYVDGKKGWDLLNIKIEVT